MLNKTPLLSSNNNVELIDELSLEFNKDVVKEEDIVDILVKHKVIKEEDADNFIKENKK